MSSRKIIPPYLKKGDEVAIISPSFAIDEDKLQSAVPLLESWGLKVRTGANVLRREGPFAGSDEERLADLQAVTTDTSIKAVSFTNQGVNDEESVDYLGRCDRRSCCSGRGCFRHVPGCARANRAYRNPR